MRLPTALATLAATEIVVRISMLYGISYQCASMIIRFAFTQRLIPNQITCYGLGSA
jgi:hypothetical protein